VTNAAPGADVLLNSSTSYASKKDSSAYQTTLMISGSDKASTGTAL
jgi:hypothetical protein